MQTVNLVEMWNFTEGTGDTSCIADRNYFLADLTAFLSSA